MTILRHAHYGRPSGSPHIPHIEQMALHAVILALTLTVVLLAVI